MSTTSRLTVAQPNRLTGLGRVDRDRPLSFRFDGRCFAGYAGDTLASALLASGIRLVGRSFKYHRPRGVLTAGSEEPNALVELRTGQRCEPNTRATVTELFEGLEACSQNRWPSLSFDLRAVHSLFSPLLGAGFYYKTFMWPAALWERVYEPAIRRAAGLGRASLHPDPDTYEKVNAFCDVLIIGGGPAGLAAAVVAGRSGARVLLCDEDFVLGGRLNSDRREIDGIDGSTWARHVEAELGAMPDVRILRRTTVFGTYDHGMFGALERVSDHLLAPPLHQPRQRLWNIVAKRAVLTTGAIEQPIVFGGNDRPGVMMASAVRTYLKRFGVAAGRRVAVFTTTDDGWSTAFDLAGAGVPLQAIVDARSHIAPALLHAAKQLTADLFIGARVIATHGWRELNGITIRDCHGRTARLAVDTLAVSGGWSPNIALTTHVGGRPAWSDTVSAFVPGTLPRGMTVAGAAGGSLSLALALSEGAAAGSAAAVSVGLNAGTLPEWHTGEELTGTTPLWYVPESRGKSFVDFQHDVTREDVELASQEGFRPVELLKRYTTLGMATDQGKTSSLNGHAIMAGLTDRAIPATGTTRSRPPYTPVAIGALAGAHRGKHFAPTRLTAGHRWAQERGATFVETGQWMRAKWFALPTETDWLQTVAREAKTVRTSVGVCDVSTLGKIDIQGADAGTLLDRVYINAFSTLPVGKVRYGVMLREDGFVFDDGTTARLADDRYVMSTTTANAAKVMLHLEHARQVLWPELDVQTASVTEQWSQFAVAGPRSRQVLQRLLGDALDLSNAAFPYLACVELEWQRMPVRLFRISFSGEPAYELAVPARYGDAVIRAIAAAGAEFGIAPYGLEALDVLRIEKGHVSGNELNGTTTAGDLGFERMMSTSKDFIGRTLAARPALADANRAVLVGVKPLDRSARLHVGAHFVPLHAGNTLEDDQGYLTSAAYSPMLEQWIGLGLLTLGRHRLGECVRAYDPVRSSDVKVEVVAPVFFDPTGARLRE